MNLLLIKDFCERKKIEIKRLAEETGMSEQNFHRCIRINKMQAGDLEKVAHILNVPISTFFDEVDSSNSIINGDKSAASIYGNATTITIDDKDKEIEHLKELLAEKERTIQILMSK